MPAFGPSSLKLAAGATLTCMRPYYLLFCLGDSWPCVYSSYAAGTCSLSFQCLALPGLAKHYGVGTLCSDATWASLPPNFVCRKLDLVRVKGKEQAVWVYAP